jgi:hypothetical protein
MERVQVEVGVTPAPVAPHVIRVIWLRQSSRRFGSYGSLLRSRLLELFFPIGFLPTLPLRMAISAERAPWST